MPARFFVWLRELLTSLWLISEHYELLRLPPFRGRHGPDRDDLFVRQRRRNRQFRLRLVSRGGLRGVLGTQQMAIG